MERLTRAQGEGAEERLREFLAIMEGDPVVTGDQERAEAWIRRPEAQKAQAGLMGLATMAPPHDPGKTRSEEEGLPD